MKLLIVTSHFYPENFKCNDMAFELQRRGHVVTVLAPIPDYPYGKYYDGYGVFKRRSEIINGVRVIRTFVTPRKNASPKWLALNYFTHTLFSSFRALWIGIFEKYDSIIVHETSPVTIGIPAVIIKKIRKIPLYFWVLDLWPESLSAAGGIKNKCVLKFFGKITSWLYKNSDILLIGSKGYRESITQLGNFDNKIKYFPNWVENSLLSKSENPIPDFPKGFNILVGGNMGDAQDLPHVMEAIKLLKGTPINIIFVGDGRKKDFVIEFAKNNGLDSQVHCFGRFPLEVMSSIFKRADILFMALKNSPIFSLTVPSRLQAYMSSGKPIVAMINGEGRDVIKEADCGWSVGAEDSKGLADLLLKLSKTDTKVLKEKGENGKRYSQAHYDFTKCIDNLENIINDGIKLYHKL